MSSRAGLERVLAGLGGFREPRPELEQYQTPAPVAATLVHLADLHGDLRDRVVVDLGAGTGILAIGAAVRGARVCVGVEVDQAALETARANAERVVPEGRLVWVVGDATRPAVCATGVTVVMNPPFGAQRANVHADRGFLEAAAGMARVSYSIHNQGSEEFVRAFAVDHGGTVTHAFSAELELDRQFPFHTEESRTMDVEAYRITWSAGG